MPRRPPRKIDPALDLSRNFRLAEELPATFDPFALFGRDAEWEVEMGSGKGLFLATATSVNPARDFLGLEIAHKFAMSAAARLAKAGVTNGVVVSGDGLKVFREWIPSNRLSAVHVYFPDPWWKKRHRKRRVMNDAFLKDVERTLIPGGSLHFWTDVEEYFQTTLELIPQACNLQGPMPVEERAAEHDLDYRTHFERRMRMHELPVYRSEFRKLA
jgi:tRNA (guanine-N7-)-methyltransferase